MMLAARFTDQAVAGWWLSEKFDGVRLLWDGAVCRTRTWRAIQAPAWFTAALPRGVCLDGELWGGAGSFQIASELARFERSADPAWRGMKFRLFDRPTTDAVKFEDRQAALAAFANNIVQPVPVRRCLGREDAREAMAAIVAAGGEGLVLKRPASCYVFGRSSDWLKVKPAGVD